MRAGLIAIVVIIAIVVVVALNSLFIVNPTQQALVLQFGQVRQAIQEPGLNFKIPLVQEVRFLDRRNLDLNVPAQEIIAADQKRLVVDAFMRYRVGDPVRFYQTVNNVREGASRLSTFVQASLRAVLADATFEDIVRDNRSALMQRIRADVANRAADIGVEVVDVRLRRADLPEANSEAIYRRMQTERQQEAREIRARGQEAAQRVRAAADRTATVLRAEAQREAEQIRGTGDAQRSAIFANAYTQDEQFFAFYRAMQAYEESLRSQDTRLVLSPDSEFFRYFANPFGVDPMSGAPAAAPAPAALPAGEDAAPAETDEQAALEAPAPTEAAADAAALATDGTIAAEVEDSAESDAAVAEADAAVEAEQEEAAAAAAPAETPAAPDGNADVTTPADTAAPATDTAAATGGDDVAQSAGSPESTAETATNGDTDTSEAPAVEENQAGSVTIVRPGQTTQ
ncbi:protease modulator HflC [Acuticoccus kandeliae]|uniref:protease modulator HflC n=1 Tax=Acuticoccus kandeliae TaxID=2073160 RepID=UPI0014736E47